MAEVNRRYFESLMEAHDLSLRALAKRMGLSHSQLSLTFSGDRRLQLEEAAQISSIFGEPLGRVVENAGVVVRTFQQNRVSVIGAMQGDGTVRLHEEGVIERTNAPESMPENSVGVQARTAGTPLDFTDGWIFFMAKPSGVDTAILGRFCLAKIKGGPAVMAGVRRGYLEGTYNLSGTYTAESVKLEWATPVLLTRN